MVSELKELPCMLEFKQVDVEDRAESIKCGHYVGRTVDIVVITPSGGRDNVERPVLEWLESKKRTGDKWHEHYRKCYDAWKGDQEQPIEGNSIKSWPMASPSEVATLKHAGIRTVEELAVANEATLGRVGMGSRALQAKAKTWLKTAADVGRATAQITSLEQKVADLEEKNEEQASELARLRQQLASTKSKHSSVDDTQPEPRMN